MLSRNQVKLITSLHHKKFRKEENLFIAEGEKVVTDLLQSAYSIRAVFCTKDFIDKNSHSALFSKRDDLTIISEEELNKISALTSTQHVLAIAEIPKTGEPVNYKDQLKLVLDGIKDPGNIGTLIRTADWFGIRDVICSDDCVDCYNPKVVQASMGSLFRTNVVYAQLSDIFKFNQEQNNLPVYGMVLNGKNIYKEELLQKGFIFVGNESRGISDENMRFITHPLTIPSADNSGADSLNAAIAAGIVCSEFFRR